MNMLQEVKAMVVNGSSLEEVNKKLKLVASMKCRLKKQMGRADARARMIEVEECEAILKSKRDELANKPRRFTNLTEEDISTMEYEEVIRAIKSIQSKKSNTRWLTDVEGDNDEYRNACRIEALLQKRRDGIKPTSRLASIIEEAKNNNEMTKEELIALLETL